MQLAIVNTVTFVGIHAQRVRIETHISNGLPKFLIVGLPETAVKESKERVRSALLNSHFDFPNRRITVNLSPAELPKAGSGFDLAIALSILAASKQLPIASIKDTIFIGELALNGEIRGVRTILPALNPPPNEILIIPKDNCCEISVIKNDKLFFATHLLDVCSFLKEQTPLLNVTPHIKHAEIINTKDWSDIKGQETAKRGLEIAVSGGHHAVLYGPPGSGKTMLSERLNTLLPTLNETQQIETQIIHSIANKTDMKRALYVPPFRAPHHTTSTMGMVGGGNPIKPGEISLAHNGILFLDELTEYKREILESLREPLESRCITISRAAQTMHFPANFQLIAAFNPCPCGYQNHPTIPCSCSSERISHYHRKLSGPLLDRIDIFIDVQPLPIELITQDKKSESSNAVRERVIHSQTIQRDRQDCLNSELHANQLKEVCHLDEGSGLYLNAIAKKLMLSGRAYYRILKLARTIADMTQDINIRKKHLTEALLFRLKNQTSDTFL